LRSSPDAQKNPELVARPLALARGGATLVVADVGALGGTNENELVTDLDAGSGLDALVDEIRAGRGEASSVVADITNPADGTA
jgi:hypothetical protein